MPTPREAYTNTVEQRPYGGERLQAGDFGAAGEMLGRAAQGFGQDLNKVAVDIDAIQEAAAVAKAKQGDNEGLIQASQAITDYEQLEGLAAKDAYPALIQRLDAIEKERGEALKNPRAQRIFSEVFAQRKATLQSKAYSHVAKEVKKAAVGSSIARRDLNTNAAADLARKLELAETPEEVTALEAELQTHIGTAISEIATITPGLSPDELAMEEAKVRSTVHTKAIQTIQGATAREAWRVKYSKDILPDAENELIRTNRPALEKDETQAHTDDFVVWNARKDAEEAAVAAAAPTEGAPAVIPEDAIPINPIKGTEYNPAGRAGRAGDGPTEHGKRGSDNLGRDFAAAAGSPIRPATSGKVEGKGYIEGTNGNYVRVRYDDGQLGIWLHMKSESPLKNGDRVGPDTIIGLVGSTGRSSGPHVHYSLKDANDNYVDVDKAVYNNRGVVRGALVKAGDVDTEKTLRRSRQYAIEMNLTRDQGDRLDENLVAGAQKSRALFKEQEGRAVDAAQAFLNTIDPRAFTSYDQLPFAVQQEVNKYPQAVEALKARITNNKEYHEAKRERAQDRSDAAAQREQDRDDKVSGNLWFMKTKDAFDNNPKEAMEAWAENRTDLVGILSRDDFNYYDNMAREIRKNGGLSSTQIARSTVVKSIQPLLRSVNLTMGQMPAGLGADAKNQWASKVRRAEEAATDAVQQWQKDNPTKRASEGDIIDIGNRVLAVTNIRTPDGGQRKDLMLNGVKKDERLTSVMIPTKDYDRVEAYLKAKKLPSNSNAVLRAWRGMVK